MRCEEFELELQAMLDRREALEAHGGLTAHAADCAACRETLRGWEAVSLGFELHETPALPANFADQVVQAALLANGPAEPATAISRPAAGVSRPAATRSAGSAAPNSSWPAASTAMFAALAVTLLMLLMASPAWQPQPNERENVVGRPGENPVAPVEAVAGNSPNELETERSGEPELPGRAAVAAASAPAPGLRERLSDALPRDVLAMLEMPMLESNDTVRAIEHMATGLRPIASSVEYTIDRLRQALPGTRSSMQEEKPQARVFRPAGWVA